MASHKASGRKWNQILAMPTDSERARKLRRRMALWHGFMKLTAAQRAELDDKIGSAKSEAIAMSNLLTIREHIDSLCNAGLHPRNAKAFARRVRYLNRRAFTVDGEVIYA